MFHGFSQDFSLQFQIPDDCFCFQKKCFAFEDFIAWVTSNETKQRMKLQFWMLFPPSSSMSRAEAWDKVCAKPKDIDFTSAFQGYPAWIDWYSLEVFPQFCPWNLPKPHKRKGSASTLPLSHHCESCFRGETVKNFGGGFLWILRWAIGFWGEKTSPAYQNPIKLRLYNWSFLCCRRQPPEYTIKLVRKKSGNFNTSHAISHLPSFRSSFHPIASCSSRPSIKSVLGPISTATPRQKGSCSTLIIYNNVAGCVSKLQAFADFSLKPTTFKLV